MLHLAIFELAVLVGNATALQPLSVVPLAVKATVPVGALPVTVAVKVTLVPTIDGLAELATPVVVVVLTTCASTALPEPLLLASPPYVATILCVPALKLAVLQVAVFELAVPVGNATAAQPLNVVPFALNATVPVGALPATVAVKVTFAPAADGLAELAMVVLLALLLLTTCDNGALPEPVLAASPE